MCRELGLALPSKEALAVAHDARDALRRHEVGKVPHAAQKRSEQGGLDFGSRGVRLDGAILLADEDPSLLHFVEDSKVGGEIVGLELL